MTNYKIHINSKLLFFTILLITIAGASGYHLFDLSNHSANRYLFGALLLGSLLAGRFLLRPINIILEQGDMNIVKIQYLALLTRKVNKEIEFNMMTVKKFSCSPRRIKFILFNGKQIILKVSWLFKRFDDWNKLSTALENIHQEMQPKES